MSLRQFSWSRLAGLASAALILAGCASGPSQQNVTLKIAAADNLAPVLRQLASEYVEQQPWVHIEFTFANTATLEKHLQDPKQKFDIYIPGRAESVNALADHGAIAPKSRFLLGINQLVVVASEDSTLPLTVEALIDPKVQKIAVADPNKHWLGFLTRQSLTNLRLLPVREATPLVGAPPAPDTVENLEAKLLVMDDEAGVLTAVKDGSAQVGITFATYADARRDMRILSPLPLRTYETVGYNTAILRSAPNYDEAWNFLNFLRSQRARAVMQQNGLLSQ